MSKKRIVVTGIGVITSLGQTVEEYWKNLLAGKSGIRKVTRFDATDYPSKVAAEVDFDPTRYMDPKEAKRNDRFTQFALAATQVAVKDAGLDLSAVDKTRMGVLIASGIGGMETIETQSGRLHLEGPRRVSPSCRRRR